MGYVFCTLQAAHAAHSQNYAFCDGLCCPYSQNLSFMTAYVALIFKTAVTMTDRLTMITQTERNFPFCAVDFVIKIVYDYSISTDKIIFFRREYP